jgi:hypothetical protein
MAARRLLILMLVLLVASTLAATLISPQTEQEETTSRTDTASGERARDGTRHQLGDRVSKTIDASAGGIERIRLRLGDQLALSVRSATADQVEIPALGLIEDVDPDAPAKFDLLPQAPGAFEVRLLDARRAIGRIMVRRR